MEWGARELTGWPSPATETYDGPLELSRYVSKRPEATFFFRVAGDPVDSGLRAGEVRPGDVLAVDRSIEPSSGRWVVAVAGDERVLGRLVGDPPRLELPANAPAAAADIGARIVGVVTALVRRDT